MLVLSGYLSLLIFTLDFKKKIDIFKNQRTVGFGFFLLGLKIRIQNLQIPNYYSKTQKNPEFFSISSTIIFISENNIVINCYISK